MKIAANGLLLSLLLLLSACATKQPVNTERPKALAMAAENGAALLLAASFPLQYYCAHGLWPSELKPSEQSRPLLAGIHHLNYHLHGDEYAAKFQLQSFVKGDDFTVDWHMLILPPASKQTGVQIVPIVLTAQKYEIYIPFEYELECQAEMIG